MANEKFQIEISANSQGFAKSIKEMAKNLTKALSDAGADSTKNLSKEFSKFERNRIAEAKKSYEIQDRELIKRYKGRWTNEDFKAAHSANIEDIKRLSSEYAPYSRAGMYKMAGGALAAGATGSFLSGQASPLMAGIGTAIGALFKAPGVGAAVGAAAGGISDVYGGAYRSRVAGFLKLRGMGYNLGIDTLKKSGRLGYGIEETTGLVESILTSTGKMGSEGYGFLNKAQQFGRAYGVESETMGGVFQSIKQAGGGDYQKKTAEIYASAFATKLEKSRIGEYLQQTSMTISEFATKTGGVNTGQIASMMGQITGMGKVFTPSRAGNIISGIDEMIRNPSNSMGSALLLNVMGKTLKQGGYKGNIIQGIQTLQTTGLAGVDLSQFGPETQKEMEVYKHYSPERLLRNLASDIKKMGNAYNQAGLIGSTFFKGGAPIARSFIEEATKAGGLSDKALEKYVKELDIKTTREAAGVMAGPEGTTAAVEKFYEWAKLRFGEKMGPSWIKSSIGDFLGGAKISNSVSDFYKNKGVGFGPTGNLGFTSISNMAEYEKLRANGADSKLTSDFIEELTFPVKISSVFRTQEEQDKLRAQGKTRAKFSKHSQWKAVDILMKDLSPENIAEILNKDAENPNIWVKPEYENGVIHIESIQPNSVQGVQVK